MSVKKSSAKKLVFSADIASGLQGCNFAISPCVDSIRYNNRYNKVKFPFWAFSSNGEFGREWIREEQYRQETERIISLAKRPGGLDFFANRLRNSIKQSEKIKEIVWRLLPTLKNLSQTKLLSAYERFIKKYNYYFGLGVLTFVYESVLSEKFLELLVKNGRSIDSLESILKSSYRSFMFQSEEGLKAIKKEKNIIEKNFLIDQYITDFYYIKTDYHQGPIVDRRYVLNRLKSRHASNGRPIKKNKIRLSSEEGRLAELLKLTEGLRDCRKKINLVGLYGLFRFLDEVSRRTPVPLKIARRAFWFEYRDLISHPLAMIKTLKKRRLANLIYDRGDCYYLDYQALKERRAVNRELILRGVPASAGLRRGRIKLVLSRADFSKLKKGDILATTMTRPEFLPIMKRAGAVITEEGGITSHAAIVARELKIACIVGLKNLTRVVKDNYLVEVDADHGQIKILNK